jgi:MoaA/NifB/PqqE/SkfB family radical SAM enzyme
LALAERFGPGVGVRVSLEGLPAANDELRGLEHGFDHGLRTILGLKALGLTDIGFGITVSDRNAADMDSLYELAGSMGLEFATAVTHNSFYFHKADNELADPEAVAAAFEALARRMLRTGRPKEWFRAWFNMGLANRARGGKRPLPCRAGTDMFFLDPSGDILPCNGSGEPMVMGNLHEEPFDLIWNSERADKIRQAVSACDRQCWMIGTAGPAMKRKIGIPAAWVARNKLRLALDRECALDPVGGAKEGPGRKS